MLGTRKIISGWAKIPGLVALPPAAKKSSTYPITAVIKQIS